ncbi:MAG: Ldh family oxidoreductase [Elusimicrobiota bacterium]|nr:Ldh family oxidoreductase [Elusimicrobiota bacterium]MDH5661461.1 Ldh family oxidoreductase [Elusimicrobiota bacterium]
MEKKQIILKKEFLENFVTEVFKKLGLSNSDARIVADIIVAADLRGFSSHGVSRLKRYVEGIKTGSIEPVARIKVVKETPVSALIDGGNGLGQVVAYRAMQKCMEIAEKTGVGFVGAKNSNHFGIAGYYSAMALAKNMVGISVTNARASVAPTFGVEPVLGTNPISVAVPTGGRFPFVLDMATSIIQRGKLEVLERENKEMLSGWAIDEKGKTLINPQRVTRGIFARKAALLPLGGIGEDFSGHKGYGLGLLVDILCAGLTGANYGLHLSRSRKGGYNLGHFFGAIKIELFRPIDEFQNTIDSMFKEIKGSRKFPGEKRIYVAGEKEFEMENRKKKEGIPIHPEVFKYMNSLQATLKIKGLEIQA